MDRIRVVITKMPRMLHEIIHTILSGEPDLALEVATVSSEDIGTTATLHNADVVIFAEPALTGVDYDSVLYAHPHLRLVAIAGDGRRAMLYNLRPTRVSLGELSSQVLVDAIRTRPTSRRAS